jgi:hypothetical protein
MSPLTNFYLWDGGHVLIGLVPMAATNTFGFLAEVSLVLEQLKWAILLRRNGTAICLGC